MSGNGLWKPYFVQNQRYDEELKRYDEELTRYDEFLIVMTSFGANIAENHVFRNRPKSSPMTLDG